MHEYVVVGAMVLHDLVKLDTDAVPRHVVTALVARLDSVALDANVALEHVVVDAVALHGPAELNTDAVHACPIGQRGAPRPCRPGYPRGIL